MKRLALPLLIALAAATGSFAADELPKIHRVVIQVQLDGADKWQEVLNNIENLQLTFGADKVQVKVVTHGAGAGLVLAKESTLRERITKLQASGAVFEVCGRTCAKKNIKQEDLDPGVTIVDSGVAEVVRLQEQGWSYLKGGS